MKNEINKFKAFLRRHIKNDTDFNFSVISKHRRMNGNIEEKETSFSNLLQWFDNENVEYIRNCSYKSKRMLINGKLYTIKKD